MKHRILLILCIAVLVMLPACGSGVDNKEQIEMSGKRTSILKWLL